MTENTTSKGTGIDAFERLLETFGSDRTRWPAAARRDFAALTKSDEAGARLKEAAALDRLLDLAAPPQIDTSALAARIVAAARAEAPGATPAPSAARSSNRFERRNSHRRAAEAPWAAAALLAASLVLGMFVGVSGAFEPAVGTAVAEADAGFDSEVDADQLAFDSDRISMFEGDLL